MTQVGHYQKWLSQPFWDKCGTGVFESHSFHSREVFRWACHARLELKWTILNLKANIRFRSIFPSITVAFGLAKVRQPNRKSIRDPLCFTLGNDEHVNYFFLVVSLSENIIPSSSTIEIVVHSTSSVSVSGQIYQPSIFAYYSNSNLFFVE